MTCILGISAYFHDSAAAVLVDGQIVAAAQEERFSRVKHDPAFPAAAARACLRHAGLDPSDVDQVVFYEKPFLRFERLLETCLNVLPSGLRTQAQILPTWFSDKLFMRRRLERDLHSSLGPAEWGSRLRFSEHHLSHAASAFYPSPYSSAAVVTLDGVGEWSTTAIYQGQGELLTPLQEIRFPHSLGLLYSTATAFLGFRVNSGEYKVMGMAAYGKPKHLDAILRFMLTLNRDGSYWLNPRFFSYTHSMCMYSSAFGELFGLKPRPAEAPLEQGHYDLAASIQAALELAALGVCRQAFALTGEDRLCLAGGVALNCVMNARVRAEGPFREVWVQPAAGDAGGAMGAALAYWHATGDIERPRWRQTSAALGLEYGERSTVATLDQHGAKYVLLDPEDLSVAVAKALADDAVVGWHQGRSEFGPRALGSRSILANPRAAGVQDRLNRRVKSRESFRPFAPVLRCERLADTLGTAWRDPFMVFTQTGLGGMALGAAAHVDGSSRAQTIQAEDDPLLWHVLERFESLTGCPALVNTSFNVRGEPMVESPEDALRCFMHTDMDALVIGRALLWKSDQPAGLIQGRTYEPD
ncbi:Predicted carbamoyl transferase%2C NodU family [Achromobacter sp. 2789STDY5608633]|jgi:carbamoyltransferase|uniref:carbamoyltransferase family protein n=1 Tax=Achromobacter sp. 2789STDY5608633 TaxID=1806501 RepID=UPI0006C3C17E|nr:carbamoyltransferase N-terminal domain-containing protein [Achromobacter sp. 2789STDY5608633]CUJ69284.1 Predicted carbamoyl transferase%2C NodU family [Achromobacter sp. 2789STDY5608633]